METVYLVRCINCKKKDFHEEHEGGKLVCDNCGLIGHTETVSESEIDDIVQQLSQSTIDEPEVGTMTKSQYNKYGKELYKSSSEMVTLDNPPVQFNRDLILSHLNYTKPKNLLNSTELMYIDINQLSVFMGNDNVALAHTKLYTINSIDLLAWLLDGIHFSAHNNKTEDINYSKNPESFIKYLIDSKNPIFYIPTLDYTAGIFNILDGRHRLGLYRYFDINGLVYVNKEGVKKIENLGGQRFCEYTREADSAKEVADSAKEVADSDIEESVGPLIWNKAKFAVSTNNNNIPPELTNYMDKIKYKKAVKYLKTISVMEPI